MDEPLDIVVLGFEGDLRQAEAKLVDAFGLDRERAQRLLRALPVLVKRRAGPETARRYVEALSAIGARVETRASTELPSATEAPISALPLPPTSTMARLRESVRVERETARAIRRFRASEGLSEEPPINLLNPSIPKAPALPRDLASMPDGAASHAGDAPGWVIGDPMEQAQETFSSAPPSLEAQRPPPHSVAAEYASSSAPAPRHSFIEAVRSTGGEAGLPVHSRTPSGPPLRRPQGLTRLRHSRFALLGLLVVVTLLALWTAGLLPSEERSREAVWRTAGIEPGEYAAAGLWLALSDNRIEGLSQAEARTLLDKLTRAGAKDAYAVQIQRSSGRALAHGLLIELPRDPEARRTIFWHAAQTKSASMLHMDTGQRFYVLEFK